MGGGGAGGRIKYDVLLKLVAKITTKNRPFSYIFIVETATAQKKFKKELCKMFYKL